MLAMYNTYNKEQRKRLKCCVKEKCTLLIHSNLIVRIRNLGNYYLFKFKQGNKRMGCLSCLSQTQYYIYYVRMCESIRSLQFVWYHSSTNMYLKILLISILFSGRQCLDTESFYSYLQYSTKNSSAECAKQKSAFLRGLINGDVWAARSKITFSKLKIYIF